MQLKSHVLVAVVLFASLGMAQKIPPYKPPTIYKPVRLDLYTSYCGLWRTDRSFESTIRLNNQLVISPIDATITLFMQDGTPYVLPPVHLTKSGVATVNVNLALASAPPSILPHISTFGSASVSYRYDWQGVVYASMSLLDIPDSLQFTYPFMFPMNSKPGAKAVVQPMPTSSTTEGMIWKYSEHSDAFLSFANTSQQAVNVTLSFLDFRGIATGVRQFSIPAMNTNLQWIDSSLLDDNRPIGIRISTDSNSDSLSVEGGIEDYKHGYSANVPLASTVSGGTPGPNSFASVGIMIGHQGPMMGFPAHLRFEPYAYVGNISDQPLTVSSNIYFSGSGSSAAQSTTLPDINLAPHEFRRLGLRDALRPLALNGSVSLTFSYNGPAGAVMAATGAVDQSGNYVFAVEPHAVGKSAAQSSIYWTTANGFDSMWSLWNATDSAQDLIVKFQYGDNQSY